MNLRDSVVNSSDRRDFGGGPLSSDSAGSWGVGSVNSVRSGLRASFSETLLGSGSVVEYVDHSLGLTLGVTTGVRSRPNPSVTNPHKAMCRYRLGGNLRSRELLSHWFRLFNGISLVRGRLGGSRSRNTPDTEGQSRRKVLCGHCSETLPTTVTPAPTN